MVADVLAAWPRVLSSDEEAVMGVMKPDAALGPPNTGRAVDTLALVWPKWARSRLAGRDAVCQSASPRCPVSFTWPDSPGHRKIGKT